MELAPGTRLGPCEVVPPVGAGGMGEVYRAVPVLCACLAVVLAGFPLLSQGSTARVNGTVLDQSGGAVPGATVTVTDVQRGVSRTLTTDSAGAYAASNLLPGAYTVRVEFRGFKAVERQDIVLEVSQELRVDLILQPGEQTEVVNVTGQNPLIENTNAELGGTLSNQIINDLPLDGRNFKNLLDLFPGVFKYPGDSGWTTNTNGLRAHDNYFMVEGINSNDPFRGKSVMNSTQLGGDAATILSIDAIDEFKLEQNPRAEYGWKPGAVINVGIKSGSNLKHGTAYAYGRDGSWEARNFFEKAADPKVELSLEQFGGSLGGPIKKDKLFYFGNFEEQRYRVGNAAQHAVPITAGGLGSATQNLIGACNAVRAAGTLTALSAQLAGLSTSCTPLGNYPGLFPVNSGSNGLNINTSLSSENRIDSGLVKVDYHLSANHALSGLYFISPGAGTIVDNPGGQIAQPWVSSQFARSQIGSGSWVWTPNSKWVNSFRAGYSHYYAGARPADSGQNPANYTYNGSTYHIYTGQTNPAYYGLPGIFFGGGFSFQFGQGAQTNTGGPNGVFDFTDSISVLHGNHAFKFGGEILVNQATNNNASGTQGGLVFPNLQKFFSGTIQFAVFNTGNFLRHFKNEGYTVFVQDDWRVKPRLTLNLGLRYEIYTVFKESGNLMGTFDPSLGLVQVGKQIGAPFNGDRNNFAPRAGLAWDVRGSGRTVIRAAGGIYFEQYSYDSFLGLSRAPTGVNLYTNGNATPTTAGGTINVGNVGGISIAGSATTPGTLKYNWANNSSSTPLFTASPACGDGTVTLPSGFKPQPCDAPGVDRNLRTPYVTTWTLDIQHAITRSLSVDVAYVGNHATKLLGLIDLNQPNPVGGFSPGWGNPANPNSAAGQCLASASTGYDNCNPDTSAEQAARPFNSRFPYLRYINWFSNSNFSNYNGLQASMTQRTSHGVSYVLGYTYSHSLAESPDNRFFALPIDSHNIRNLYGMFGAAHKFTASVTYAIPGIKSPGQILRGWSLNSVVSLLSGPPWEVNDTTTDFSGTGGYANSNGERWDFFGNPDDFKSSKALIGTNCDPTGCAGGIPYFLGTSNPACLAKSQAMRALAVASLTNLGCYAAGGSVLVPPAYGSYGTSGAGIFRSTPFYNVDLSVTKIWQFKDRYKAQFRAEFFNILNHPNISNPVHGLWGDATYTDPSADAGVSFGFRPQTPDVASSNPVLGSGGPRAIQLGLKLIF